MSLLNQEYLESYITTDNGVDVPYRWSHGATKKHLGDGLIVYSLIQMMRAKVCVCLGSGGGFIPRLMTQARQDLWEQGIFEEGDWEPNWQPEKYGSTYVVDAANEVGGHVYWAEENSFFRQNFQPRFIKATTEEAYYDFFVPQDIKIDFLHIDAGHSYQDVKRDFELYSKLLSPKGIITLHDTDLDYKLLVSEDNKANWDTFDGPGKFVNTLGGSWNIINLFNAGLEKDNPASTGLTIVQKRMPRLNLVTVVGDFHTATLVTMLKHYEKWVDNIVIVYYLTGNNQRFGERFRLKQALKDLLKRYGVERFEIKVETGEKYDWDKVTEFYNKYTDTEDWWLIADCDELQMWPVDPRAVVLDCIGTRKTFVAGGFFDRIGEGGEFPKLPDVEFNVDEIFPLVGFFRYPMSGACPNKVVMVQGGQKVTSGQHYAEFQNGKNSWGHTSPREYPIGKCWVPVHHLKWDATIVQRIKEVGESGCKYSEEYAEMYENIKENNFKIPTDKVTYMIRKVEDIDENYIKSIRDIIIKV